MRRTENITSAPCVPPAGHPASCVYECRVLHERFSPKAHRFVYRLFYFSLDLDELPTLHKKLAFFSLNRPNLFSFRERDFLPTTEPLHRPDLPVDNEKTPVPNQAQKQTSVSMEMTPSLKARVIAYCAARGVVLGPQARVQLISLPRVLGFQFNPVSFYFCFDSSGVPACAIAEVTNTYREVKPYFLKPIIGNSGRTTFHWRGPKHFYVSPFSSLQLAFDFTLGIPGERLAVRIDDYASDTRVLHTTLSGRARTLSNGRLAWFLLKYPLITLKIIALIHWQAFLLWLKRVPYFPKADHASLQRALYRPHSSLTRPVV